jgi:hypothetical protein
MTRRDEPIADRLQKQLGDLQRLGMTDGAIAEALGEVHPQALSERLRPAAAISDRRRRRAAPPREDRQFLGAASAS